MKKLLLIFLVVACFLQTYARPMRTDQVPLQIISSFRFSYPGAKNPAWSKIHHHVYKVAFNDGGKKYLASFNQYGLLIESNSEIQWNEMPFSVRARIYELHGCYIEYVAKKIDRYGIEFYTVRFIRNNKIYNIVWDWNGEKQGK